MNTLNYRLRATGMLLLLFYLITPKIDAQTKSKGNTETHIDTTFQSQISYVFGDLDKSKIPNSLLLDFGMNFSNVEAYNGQLTDSTNLNSSTYLELYKTMDMSRVLDVTQGFSKITDFTNAWTQKRHSNNVRPETSSEIASYVPTIVLSGMFYNYSKIKDNALSQNKIAVQNGKYQDVYNNRVWQNPYETKRLFAVSPQVLKVKGLKADFLLPTNLWLTNSSSSISKFEMDASDGYGYRQINLDQKIRVSYSSASQNGNRELKFKLTLNSGVTLLSRFIFQFGNISFPSAIDELKKADSTFFMTSNESYNGNYASGYVSIKYAAGRSQIRKPLIVAEGFDPGIIMTPEYIYGVNNLDDFFNNVNNSSTNLRELLNGSSREYDIIYVDWYNGVADMRKNSKLLKSVIQWVNSQKASNGIIEKNVLLGRSMGGVIARYTLRKMELDNIDHDTRLYISDDAPHQGANVPYGLQFAARHMRNEYIKSPMLMSLGEHVLPLATDLYNVFVDESNQIIYPSSLYDAITLADNMASKQLLINYVKKDYTIDNSIHNAWQTELNNLGYPQTTEKNVAISNGSVCGEGQKISPGDYIFKLYGTSNPAFINSVIRQFTDVAAGITLNNSTLIFAASLPGHSKFEYDFWVKSVPTVSNKQVYRGNITYTKYLLFLVPINFTLMNTNLDAPSGSLPLDTYAGGYYDLEAEINLNNLPSFIGDKISHLENFNFVPTVSAFDVGSGSITLNSTDYGASYSSTIPPTGTRQIPFDSFIAEYDSHFNPNSKHITLNADNGLWLFEEITDGTTNNFDCSYMCSDLQIQGSSNVCSSSTTYNVPIYDHTTYNWTVIPTTGITLANSDTNNVTLTVGSEAAGTYILSAYITNSNCGTSQITKTITVGKPKYSISPLDSNAPSTEAWAYINGDDVSLSSQGISHPTYSVISSSGTSSIYILGPYSSGNEYKIRANGSNNTWSKTIDIHIQNSCGTTTKRVFLVPPPPSGGCDYTLQSTNVNTYSFLPPPGCLSSFQTMALSESSLMMNSELATPNIYSIKVYDMNGVLLLETDEQTINLDGLKKGFYIIKATWNGNETTKKVAKK